MKTLLYITLFLAIAGLIDASYITASLLTDTPIQCGITENCEQVTRSEYGTMLGIPVSAYGMAFYLTVVALVFWVMARLSYSLPRKLLALVAAIGFGWSIYFTYLQAFVLEAWCMYCIFSATMSTLIFIFSLLMICKKRSVSSQAPQTKTINTHEDIRS